MKVLELGLGKLVSSVHGIKRRKAVSWERLGLGLKNRVVFRRNKRPYFLTITIDFSEKSFAMPQVYTIIFCLSIKQVTAREAILFKILFNDEIKLAKNN